MHWQRPAVACLLASHLLCYVAKEHIRIRLHALQANFNILQDIVQTRLSWQA